MFPLEVDGTPMTISGVVDLVNVLPNRVELRDYKTDVNRDAVREYRPQDGVFVHVLRTEYPDRPVEMSLVFTSDGEVHRLRPLPIQNLRNLVTTHPTVTQ